MATVTGAISDEFDPYLPSQYAPVHDVPHIIRLNPDAPVARALIEQIKKEITGTGLQDGLCAYYNSQAPLADANIEKRLEKEPYEWPHFNKSL